jgi:hypothetical protein
LAAGVSSEPLFSALTEEGIPPADLAHADTVRFSVRERLTVPIDSTSPRIVPETFTGGARPVGVIDITYRVDLDHILERALDDSAMKALIAELGGPAAR